MPLTTSSVGPYHHDMSRPRVADGRYGLQIWRVSANILNKHSRTTDNDWFSSLGDGRGANNSSPGEKKKRFVMNCYYTGPQAWTHSLERPRQCKTYTRFGNWNIGSLHRAGSMKTVASDLEKSSGSTGGQVGQWWQSASR
jgi:hypothetical protein